VYLKNLAILALIAQLVEQTAVNREVIRLNPLGGAEKFPLISPVKVVKEVTTVAIGLDSIV
jgi:hypothetical protein